MIGDRDEAPETHADLRASDRDRDAALDVLASAASDGRLTLEEYSGRADLALRARTHGELALLTRDLGRAGAQPRLDESEPLTAILGSASRTGPWRVPQHLSVRSVLGDCQLELQEATLTSHITRIDVTATLGAVTITVPEGVDVRLTGTAVLGEKSSKVRAAAAAGAPVIEVRARVVLGQVSVRPPRATLVDRLRAL